MNPQKIRLYSLIPFDRGAKARWLLAELGVPYEDRVLDAEAGEHEKPDFLRINPMGRVPAMELGDVHMFESDAICTYLADLHLDRGLAPGLSSPDRATYLQWISFAGVTLSAIQSKIMIVEDIPAGEVRTTKEGELLDELKRSVQALNQPLSGGASYLVGNKLSTADLCVGYHLYWLTLWPELNTIISDYPKVVNYLDRLKKLPSASKAAVFSYEG